MSLSIRGSDTTLRQPSESISVSPSDTKAGLKRPLESDEDEEDDTEAMQTPKRVKREET
jgi:hypothetical protein